MPPPFEATRCEDLFYLAYPETAVTGLPPGLWCYVHFYVFIDSYILYLECFLMLKCFIVLMFVALGTLFGSGKGTEMF